MNLWKRLKKILKQFCRETSIHGLVYIVGRVRWNPWLFLFLLSLGVCIWQCCVNVADYFSFNVQTTTTRIVAKSFDFPSLTFTIQHPQKASGFHDFFPIGAMREIRNKSDTREVESIMNLTEKVCAIKEGNEHGYSEVNLLKDPELFSSGMATFDSRFYVQLEELMVTCIWNNIPFNCSGAFGRYFGADGPAFTFNIGNDIAENFKQHRFNTFLNYSAYNQRNYMVTSPNTGLRLIMKLDQGNQCDLSETFGTRPRYGTGLKVKVHGANSLSFTFFDTFISLSPGYDIQISLQQVMINRNTEHLGRCKSRVIVDDGKSSVEYIQWYCYLQCLMDYVIDKCHCRPLFYSNLFSSLPQKGWKFEHSPDCAPFDACMYSMEYIVKKEFNPKNCKCPPACSEHKYVPQITSKMLLNKFILNEFYVKNMSDVAFRKNYLALSVNFMNMEIEVMKENQAFTCKDMFIYIGGNIGLFLGMSFISPFEPVFLIAFIVGAIGTAYNIRPKTEKLQKFWPWQKQKVQAISIKQQDNQDTPITENEVIEMKCFIPKYNLSNETIIDEGEHETIPTMQYRYQSVDVEQEMCCSKDGDEYDRRLMSNQIKVEVHNNAEPQRKREKSSDDPLDINCLDGGSLQIPGGIQEDRSMAATFGD